MNQTVLAPHMQIRIDFLHKSLMIEATISGLLSQLLGVKDASSSKSFGNSSSALSYNAKVLLFLDLGFIRSEDYWKFQKFMEIRNQFMHNLEAASYEECFSYLKGAEEKLLKEYPKIKLKSKEARLKKAALTLANDVFIICIGLSRHIIDVKREKTYGKIFQKCVTSLLTLLKELKKKSPNKDTISAKELLHLYQASVLNLIKEVDFTE